MKTFSKRLLTMILAVSMVFGLSGMTTFAAEAEDAAAQDEAAEAEALSVPEESTTEETVSEAVPEEETETASEDGIATLSSDDDGITTLADGEFDPISISKNGVQLDEITEADFRAAEDKVKEQEKDPTTKTYYSGANHETANPVEAYFVPLSALLTGDEQPDEGCSVVIGSQSFIDYDFDEIFLYDTGSGLRSAVDESYGAYWVSGFSSITVGHTFDADGVCTVCGKSRLDLIDYNVKYAVCLWGINQGEDRYGNTLGLTFGPATGDDYRNTYAAHISEEDYNAGKGICLHWMTWEEIIAQSEEDPTAFEDCLKNGCTHSVNLKLNSTLLATSYENQMNGGDGAGMLYDSVASDYRSWNASNSGSDGGSVGWPASQIRAVLNGKDRQTDDTAANALDSSDCLLSCFPSELQNGIVATAVTSDTVSSSQSEEDAKTTYDKLWLPSGREVYGDSSDGENNGVIRANEGTLSTRSLFLGITTKENLGLLADYDETGAANAWRLRSLSTSDGNSYQVAADGNFGAGYYTANTVGIAPCFSLWGKDKDTGDSYYDVKYAVSIWGINHDIDEEKHILGLTFGPATGADYRNDYVAHMSEEEYEASDDAYCIHWMTWEEIADQAEDDPTVFQECLEKGCTHSVNITLNDTIRGASYADEMDDGDGVSGLLNCIKLWNLDPPYEYVSTSYRYWNSSSKTDGGWPASQIRSVLNGKDALLGDYADNALDKDDCLFSCFPADLQKAIVPKAVPSATVPGSEEKEDIMLTGDSLWLFSSTEVWGHGDERYDSYLNPAEGALYERSALRGVTTSNYLSALQNYDEEGTEEAWFLRSMYSSYGNVDIVNNTRDWPTYVVANSGSVSCAPGFCLGVTNATAGDKSALKAEYDADSGLDEYDYTEESWAPFAAALENAKALLDAGAVTQGPLDAALQTLINAREALKSAVNKTRLQAEYEEDILLKEDRYTAESWAPFAKALEKAEEILDATDPEAFSQQEVDEALAALQEAKAALVRDFNNSKVSYAVKIWGIGADKYSNDDGNLTYTTGLTFGPATGADHLTSYVSRETVLAAGGSHDSEFCIHDMTWEDIIEQSKEDPSVFESCKENGCTKAVELTPNEKLFNITTLDNYLDQEYSGDGVSTLYYLLNGTGSAGYTYGANWNYATSGYSDGNTPNLYSTSRIRVTLNGDSTDAELKFASSTGDGSDLCDETDCLLSCFPEELQEAIVPRKTVNAGEPVSDNMSYDDKTTYDKLFLFSLKEGGISDYSYDGGGGNDYGVNPEAADRCVYEFTNTNASSSSATLAWWSRSPCTYVRAQNMYVDIFYSSGQSYKIVTDTYGVSPGFSLPGPFDKSGLQEEYDADSQLNEADYTSWSWGPFAEAMEAAGEVLASEDVTQDDVDEMLTELKEAREALVEILDVSFTSITAEGIEGDDVTIYYGADIELATDVTYKPSDATLAYQWYEVAGDGTETAITGETEPTLTLSGAMSDSGTYKCVVTASSDRQDDMDAETSITVTVTDEAMVNYAVKIWGIGHDEYSYETKKITNGADVDTMTAGLTFGPATGDNEEGDGTGFLNAYKAHLTEEEYKADEDAYCIHWMSWDEIAEQSKTDPSVFDACMKNGCTKAVEISLNEKLANRTTVNSYLNRDYTGDGVSALYYLLNGTNNSSASVTYGANWNYSTYSLSGSDYTDRANLYSRSRIRATLTGDSEDARERVAAGWTDYYDLATVCDETNCLFSCFPEDLQEVVVPRLTLNHGGTGAGNDPNADHTDTFDKLFLFSMRETGLVDSGTRGDFDDAGGYDYGVNESDSDRIAYEFTGTSATDISEVKWWTRSRYDEWSTGADCISSSGGVSTNNHVSLTAALAPGFCLPGPEDEFPTPTVSDVTVTSDLNGNTKTYDGKGVTLTVSATTEPYSANVSYQWYKVEDGVDTAIDQATGSELVLDGNVPDSGTYKCVVSVQSGDEIATDSATIDIAIDMADQDIWYVSTEIRKSLADRPFTNELTMTLVDPADGSGISYASSEPTVATVDETTGEVTIVSVGETTITATAQATENYTEATAPYTITVVDDPLPTTVRYAVKLWGINRDYDEEGRTLGLTFGPATGADYTNTYKAHLTEDQYDPENGKYCIHWMTWDEIIAQSKKDPEVFADCLSSGCTKAVELEPNGKLFNLNTVKNVLDKNYSGDGVGTLYYLLSGTKYDKSDTRGEGWNFTRTGYSDEDPANVYSRSRIRTVLTGDKTELEEWITEYPDYNDYYGIDTLCDETNCLLSCFPEELQNAMVPRETLNTGKEISYTSIKDKTTYDKLFLFSLDETGYTSSDADDSGGTDYGVNPESDDRIAYEFSGVDGEATSVRGWWTRSRDARNTYMTCVIWTDGNLVYSSNDSSYGVSPGFCLAGPEQVEQEKPTVSVEVTSTLEDNTMVYNGTSGFSLTATATVEPEGTALTYQWYKGDEEIPGATYNTLNIGIAKVSDSASYTCVVTATNDAGESSASATIEITVEKATQVIIFEKDPITKTIGEDPFTNELTDGSVVFGALSYESSVPGVAAVDGNGLVTLVGVGETTITATAAGSDEENYDAVSASYTLTVEAVDKAALQEEYDEDIKLIESDYTKESWESFEEALNVADGILTDDNATQDDVDDALDALVNAKAGLIPIEADKTALEDEIAATDDLVESDYTAESWAALIAALEAAEALDADEDALQSAVDKAAEDLQAAMDALEEIPADKSILDAMINAVEALDQYQDYYTEDSWNALQDALNTAKGAAADGNATQSSVNSATLILLNAFGNLVPEEQIDADKFVLNAVITVVKDLNNDDEKYTEDSWNDLQDALSAAQDMANNDAATQEDIDNATTDLVNALAGLVPEEQPAEVDKSVLNSMIKAAEALSDYEDSYTPGSWKNMQDALKAAQDVADNDEATQDMVNEAASNLVNALVDLVPEWQPAEVDKSVLNAAIAAADALKDYQDYYTEDSWNDLQDALSAANDVAKDENATQDEVNEATVNLVNALADLEPVSGSGTGGTGGSTKNGLYQITPGKEWGYYVNGKVDTSYTGFQTNENGSWYVENGYIHFDKNSVYKDTSGNLGTKGAWYYVVGNKVQYGFTGLANYKNQNGWWYIKAGKVDFSHNGVDKNVNGWWYVTGGKVQFGFTGLAHYRNANGWWYIKNGKVDFTHNGVDKNQNGWYYVTGGKVQFGFTGLAHYRNANGWWYINAGKVTFDFTGIASNQNGTWYVRDSKVQFGFNGSVTTTGGTTYTVRNGKVT